MCVDCVDILGLVCIVLVLEYKSVNGFFFVDDLVVWCVDCECVIVLLLVCKVCVFLCRNYDEDYLFEEFV